MLWAAEGGRQRALIPQRYKLGAESNCGVRIKYVPVCLDGAMDGHLAILKFH